MLPNGNYEIGVHIADVSHFQEGTILDDEAYDRATSVYLVDRFIFLCLPNYYRTGVTDVHDQMKKILSNIFN